MFIEITKLNQQVDRSFYRLFGLTRRELELVEVTPCNYLWCRAPEYRGVWDSGSNW